MTNTSPLIPFIKAGYLLITFPTRNHDRYELCQNYFICLPIFASHFHEELIAVIIRGFLSLSKS